MGFRKLCTPCTLHFGLTRFEGIKQVLSDLMSRVLSLQCSCSISAVVFLLIKSTVSDCSDKNERQMRLDSEQKQILLRLPSVKRLCCPSRASVFHSDLLVEGPVGDVAVLLAARSSLLCDDGEDSHSSSGGNLGGPVEQKQWKEN